MRKKITISILLLLIIIQLIIPIKVNAFTETREIISVPAKIEHQLDSDETQGATGLDTVAGLIIEPTVEFLTFLIDCVMNVFSDLMMPDETGTQDVMVDSISEVSETREATITYTISDSKPYKNGFGFINVDYPNFTFSAEDIFAGRVDLLNVDFISGKNSDGNSVENEGWRQIRNVVAQWYKVFRMVTIIGLLSVLIYTGIKIILASNAQNKAKYKEMIINWFIAVLLAFSLHYIMAFIMNVIGSIMSILDGVSGIIEVNLENRIFKTNLIGLARFQMQQQHFSAKLAYLIIYTSLVVYTFKFTFIYLKRVVYMAFLTIISPIVALTYPIDKMNGRAKGFEMWLKEYMYNALLQPMHYILYYILVTTSLSLAVNNPLYGIVALMFISQAEKLLRKIFGIDKAKEGTVNGLARSFATGAMVGGINNFLGEFSKDKKSNRGKGNKNDNSSDDDNYITNPRSIMSNDWSEFDSINVLPYGEPIISEGIEGVQTETQADEANITDGTLAIEGNFEGLGERERIALERYAAEGYDINENGEYFNPHTQRYDADYNPLEDEMFLEANPTLENGVQPDVSTSINEIPQPDNYRLYNEMPNIFMSEGNEEKETGGVLNGMKEVGKYIAKPIWDFERGGKYNGKRLVRAMAKGVAGVTLGTVTAATEAAISSADGKVSGAEVITAFGTGVVAGSAMIDKVSSNTADNIKDDLNAGDKEKLRRQQMERAQARYGDREDVIKFNKREFPENPKEAMRRQRDNYLPRGITNLGEMRQCMNYANVLIQEQGISVEDADRRAAVTFEFRKKLQERGQTEAIYNKDKRDKYIDLMVKKDVEDGTEEQTARRRYLNAFRCVQAFDEANA